MIDRLEVFLSRLRQAISRSEWAIRRLRLPTSEGTGPEPGLLLIQIDGFSRNQMEKAMKNGRLPFLRQLVRKQHYEVNTFYSGLPSSTPAVQAELHYGVRCAVPAFTFRSATSNRIGAMFDPEMAKAVEAHLAEQGQGLLQGGSSWSNIYTGGANQEECHFCAASIGLGDILKSGSVFAFWSIVFLQFPAMIRSALLSFVEFFIALYDLVRGVYRGENLVREFKCLLSRVLICIGLREFISVGAKIDLARGLPIVHVNFLGYDEQAHRRGPGSAFAHWSLKGIDKAIERLYHGARRSARRDYRVWIFSDHGQETTVPFPEKFPGGVEKAVGDCLERLQKRIPQAAAKSETSEAASPAESRSARIPLQLSENESESFSVAAWGPVGHVYLAKPNSTNDKRELARLLVSEGHVPGVLIARGDGQVEWHHRHGVENMPDDAQSFLPHPDPLKSEICRDLIRLCEQEFAGDLVLLGWSPDGPAWSFANERGAHAGPGMEETQGFVLLPAKTRLPHSVGDFIRPCDLRAGALHLLGHEKIPRKRHVKEHPAVRVRVMTYNVHSCRGMDGRTSPHRIAQIIDMLEPDVVALQELDLGRARTRWHDQAGMIAEELHMHVCFCPTVVVEKELYGHAILSRSPMEIVRTEKLHGGRGAESREPRAAHWVRLNISGLPLNIINTHFGLGVRERAAQVLDLLGERWIGGLSEDEPIILCGDFNMLPESVPYKALTARLRDVQRHVRDFRPLKTFPAMQPVTRLDYIFASRSFNALSVRVARNHLTRVASDHLPLIADLELVEVAAEMNATAGA